MTIDAATIPRSSSRRAGVIAGLLAILACRAAIADDRDPVGERVYKQKCVTCHGTDGSGSDEYPLPLAGTRSIAQLARFIAKSMPKDEPGTCSATDAEAVASYIYSQFYSPLAQARNRPTRIELSRLTVRQYRQSMADLIGSFRSPTSLGDEHGLHGEYYKSRRFRDGDRVLTRVDPEVRFDFGENGPEGDQFDPRQFSIRWDGSILAPDTGDYEFIVRTEHAVKLSVNDLKQPLIDAWVKSGNDNEHHASIFLVGGRAYPVRLEFSKAKQGVDDSDKQKDKPVVPASIALEWRRPKLPAEVIPSRHLSPKRASETMVVSTPFPPDDRSGGYERGTSISKEWDAAATEAAIEAAVYVSSRLKELAGARDDSDEGKARLIAFCERFAERAFRQPLTSEQREFFVQRRFESAPDGETAVKRVVLLVLKSPRFLYREVGASAAGAASGAENAASVAHAASGDAVAQSYHAASRLSFALWDSLPDDELLKAAASGELCAREQRVHQAERMLADLRTRSKLREFLLQWLKVDNVPELSKDTSRFPGFDPAIALDLRNSLELMLDDIVWRESSDFRQLLLEDGLYLNGRLAGFYGAEMDSGASFQRVKIDDGERAGVLTHPYLMATFAYKGSSSPIHRGVFLARNVLGRSLKQPPEAFTPLPAELHPNLTTRERVLLQTKPDACVACHGMINPLGFVLEKFDAVGRLRGSENGRPIDASGGYQSLAGESVAFDGVRSLAKFLAGSEEVHTAFVEQLFQNLVKQPVRAFGPNALTDLVRSFESNQFSIRGLVTEIAAVAAGAGPGPASEAEATDCANSTEVKP
jgi:cytochrome c553